MDRYTSALDLYIQAIPELRALSTVPQDNVFHQEGDVLTHTYMVIQELYKHPSWDALSPTEQHTLEVAALFHDIGKLDTTVEHNGRIRSPKHAVQGALLTRYLLWKEAGTLIPFSMREHIVHLVKNHMHPLYIFEKKDPKKFLLQLSLVLSLKLLTILAECDIRGRIGSGMQHSLDLITLCKEFAQEEGCFTTPYPFVSNHSKFFYFSKHDACADVAYHDDTVNDVILLSGLPAAGKDYWITQHGEGRAVISLDAIREELGISPTEPQGAVVQCAKERAKRLLARREPFIWNAVNRLHLIRDPLVTLCSNYNASVTILYLESDYTKHLQRNRERTRTVPEQVIEKMARRNEVPEPHEAQLVSYHFQ